MKDLRTTAKTRRKLLLRVAGVALVVAPGCGGSTADLGDQPDGQVADGPVNPCSLGRCAPDAGPPMGTVVVDAGLSINDAGPPMGTAVVDAGEDAMPVGTAVEDAGFDATVGIGVVDAGISVDDAGFPMGTVITDAGPVGRSPQDAGDDAPFVGVGVVDAGQGD